MRMKKVFVARDFEARFRIGYIMSTLANWAWIILQGIVGIIGLALVLSIIFAPMIFAGYALRRVSRVSNRRIHLSTAVLMLVATGALLGGNLNLGSGLHSVHVNKGSEWREIELPCKWYGFPLPVYCTVDGGTIPEGFEPRSYADGPCYWRLSNGDYREEDDIISDWYIGHLNLIFAALVLLGVYHLSEKSIRARRCLTPPPLLASPPSAPATPHPTPAGISNCSDGRPL